MLSEVNEIGGGRPKGSKNISAEVALINIDKQRNDVLTKTAKETGVSERTVAI